MRQTYALPQSAKPRNVVANFTTEDSPTPSFGRQNTDGIVEGEILLASLIRKCHKLLKDSPWGF